jgi:hypothetical protein
VQICADLRVETLQHTVRSAPHLTEGGHARAVAERAREWAQRAKLGRAAENHAVRIRIEAERKAGALLADTPKRDGGDAMKARSHDVTELPPKLSDLGISKQQSSDWQRMAKVPDELLAGFKDVVLLPARPA